MRALVIIGFLIHIAAVVTGGSIRQPKIIGGSVTTIEAYPFAAALLLGWNNINFVQSCGATIINNRALLTAAHCFDQYPANRWRVRVGSSRAHSGGSVFNTNLLINHPSYNPRTLDCDIAVLRVAGTFVYGPTVNAGRIAGANYNLADNQAVWAIGWGLTSQGGQASELLRHVQVWTVNQAICRTRYAELGRAITDNMLCSGWLDVGGRDQCQGDSGGPLLHNNVAVGVTSFGQGCALPRYPGVNARISRFSNWIVNNA